MRSLVTAVMLLLLLSLVTPLAAQEEKPSEKEGPFSAETFAGLALRSIGPALSSGRIGDIAVHPANRVHYFVGVASGGVWRTTNAGTTWEPVFDGEGSYSIGCITVDPANPLTVWVGTGENNSQRSVSYGDGVYKSVDGGETWKRMGLEKSEHVGRIVIDPRDSDIVYVAAQGPLWAPGGDHGLYKTIDGGKSWNPVLQISENTGVTDVALDPRDPDVIYAAAYQRRRHVWTLIDGGPESAIYKSTDAGASWEKLETGLPKVDLGRIGFALSPADPDVLYAIVEAEGDEGGFFRSTNAGSTWEKRSKYVSGSPQYYNEIIPDPKKVDRVYSMDTWMQVTEDGGKTFRRVGRSAEIVTKHVDDHALWIDPEDTDYLLAGCDGGLYESFDRGHTWQFKSNLPVTQFYRVTPDNTEPFYNVYGGTQDNNTLAGPSRTTSLNGIVNGDWYVTVTGDGYKTQIDPENPEILYSQYQYGGLVRFDKRSGEITFIQPQEAPGEDPLRWNWNSPLIISPHAPTRLYFAAQSIFRSDDRGDTWRPISPDLTRQIDRNTLEIMGKIQRADAVAKGDSTSYYGNIVSLSESPAEEGLIYAGTDDGVIQVLEKGGDWRRIERFRNVPEMSYVSDVEASRHDAGTVYASFDNHKRGDFKPYLLRSSDRGRTWISIAGNLPERGSVHSIAEDHANPELLFAGTEFGVFFTVDGGTNWVQLKGGMPTIAVRDLEIQRRENDLVAGTFGRGIYILDDYTPLREVSEELLEREAALFPVKRTWMFVPWSPLGLPGKSAQGDSFYTAPNPPFGAVFTYYLKEEIKSLREKRRDEEIETEEKGGTPDYPSLDALRREAREEKPEIILTVTDDAGNVVRRLNGPTKAGFHRVAWDLRYPPSEPVRLEPPAEVNPFSDPPRGPIVLPGRYTVSLAARVDGLTKAFGPSQSFETVPLGLPSLPAKDRAELVAFQKKVARLQRAVLGAEKAAAEAQRRIDHLKKAYQATPGAEPQMADEILALQNRLKDLEMDLSGDPVRAKYNEPSPVSIVERVERIIWSQWASSSAPTQTNRDAYRFAGEAFTAVLGKLQRLVEEDLKRFEERLEAAGAPWTPGRVPRWTME